MPFVAINKNDNSRVNIRRIKDPRFELKAGEYICEICKEPMFIRGSEKVTYHFAHYPRDPKGPVQCSDREKETPEHLLAKGHLADVLIQKLSTHVDVKVEEEFWLSEIQRKADVLVIFPMGWRIAHEIQLSPISIDELEKRTNDYLSAGIDVVWWFGNKADTETNRRWAIRNTGNCYSIQIQPENKSRTVPIDNLL